MTATKAERPKKSGRARERNCCCDWFTFYEGYEEAHAKWFGMPPSKEHWAAAVKDWRAGNTGWEAAHNAQRRAKEAVQKAAAKPLVWLGGKNYAEAGSALALRYGRSAPPPSGGNVEGEMG